MQWSSSLCNSLSILLLQFSFYSSVVLCLDAYVNLTFMSCKNELSLINHLVLSCNCPNKQSYYAALKHYYHQFSTMENTAAADLKTLVSLKYNLLFHKGQPRAKPSYPVSWNCLLPGLNFISVRILQLRIFFLQVYNV